MIRIVCFLMLIIMISGCESEAVKPNPGKELTIEEKIRQGRNTGTPADLYNRNPYSVFDRYSPYNIYQND